jgi:hypothetical protein
MCEHPLPVTNWDDIKRMATDLEITFDGSAGDVWMHKHDSVCGWFAENPAGRTAAPDWLMRVRCGMEELEVLRSLDPLPRRRMHRRWLWRRQTL